MDFDKKTFVMGCLIGLSFGLGIADLVDKDLSTAATSLGALMAGFGALGTMYLAYLALSSWKTKSDFDRLIEEVRNVRKHFLSLVELIAMDGSARSAKKYMDFLFKLGEHRAVMHDSLGSIDAILKIHNVNLSDVGLSLSLVEEIVKPFRQDQTFPFESFPLASNEELSRLDNVLMSLEEQIRRTF